jgi:hypothetical protein
MESAQGPIDHDRRRAERPVISSDVWNCQASIVVFVASVTMVYSSCVSGCSCHDDVLHGVPVDRLVCFIERWLAGIAQASKFP